MCQSLSPPSFPHLTPRSTLFSPSQCTVVASAQLQSANQYPYSNEWNCLWGESVSNGGPMINAHWQHVFPWGALLGHGSCVTPPPQRYPLILTSHRERDKLEMLLRLYWRHYTTSHHWAPSYFEVSFSLYILKVVMCQHESCSSPIVKVSYNL